MSAKGQTAKRGGELRHWLTKEDGSFFEVRVDGTHLLTRWGGERNPAGVASSKIFDTEELAEKAAASKAKEKRAAGFADAEPPMEISTPAPKRQKTSEKHSVTCLVSRTAETPAFYEVDQYGTCVDIYFGSLGKKGACHPKAFPDEGTAVAYASGKIATKKKDTKKFLEEPAGTRD